MNDFSKQNQNDLQRPYYPEPLDINTSKESTEQQNTSTQQNSSEQNPLFRLFSGQNKDLLTSMLFKNLLGNNSALGEIFSASTKSDNPLMQIMSGFLNNKKSPPKCEDKIEKIISDDDSFEEI